MQRALIYLHQNDKPTEKKGKAYKLTCTEKISKA